MSRRIPNGKYSQSNEPKDICILLVNDDDICKHIITYMLDHCRYEAFSYKREMDALNVIQQKKDVTELILTNVHRTYAKRHGIIEHIEKKIKLQIILMSPDVDDKVVSSTVGGKGVTVYFMKCLSVNDMNNLWATALAQVKSKKELSSEKLLLKENEGSKTMRNDDEQPGNEEKKPRVVWTKELHRKFLEAVAQLGEDKAFPKKIVELMNVPGLTRANVASHLQKHRFCLKQARERFRGSSYDFTDNFSFKTLQEKYHHFHWNPFQLGSRNTTTTRFNLNHDTSRWRASQRLSLLKTIRLKPDHNFSVYGDETKNVLLKSIKDSSNKNFAGFKFARDGKSVVFGQKSHLASSVQQQHQLSFPEMAFTQWPQFSDSFTPSVAPLRAGGESVNIRSQLSSLTDLAVDEPMPAIVTQPQPSLAVPGFDWNQVVTSSEASPCPDWNQLADISPPQSAAPQWTDNQAEPPPPPRSEDTANTNLDIFNDFTLTYTPLELGELGVVGDDMGVDATAMCDFDYLLFDDQDLT